MPVTLPQDALATQADLDALTQRVTALEGGTGHTGADATDARAKPHRPLHHRPKRGGRDR